MNKPTRIGFLVFAFCAASWASVIPDPAMGVEEEVLSDPVSRGIVFTPGPNGGGLFGYFNDTGNIIVRLDITTVALPGRSPSLFQPPVFICNAGGTAEFENPFFLDCAFQYSPTSGYLKISFFGVNPLDGDGLDGEAWDREGIGVACLTRCGDPEFGHFAFNLNNGFSRTDNNTGGWEDPEFFPPGPTVFLVYVNGVPEPGTILLLLSGLAYLGFTRKSSK